MPNNSLPAPLSLQGLDSIESYIEILIETFILLTLAQGVAHHNC